MLGSIRRRVAAAVLAVCLGVLGQAFLLSGTAMAAPQFGWGDNGAHWYENGVMVRDHAFYDAASNAWYWADADGSIATNKDVFIPKNEADRSQGGKWVRFDGGRRMVKGEDCRYGGWYFFDYTTGEMAKGMKYVPVNGGKWVYYDWITGQMAHGETFVNYDAAHTGWYLFDQYTGAMQYEWQTLRDGRRVYYNKYTGIMVYGSQNIDGTDYYFNAVTGNLEQTNRPSGGNNGGNPGNNNGGNPGSNNGGGNPGNNGGGVNTGVYYWLRTDAKSYHSDPNCFHIRNKPTDHGSLEKAHAAGKFDPCDDCVK